MIWVLSLNMWKMRRKLRFRPKAAEELHNLETNPAMSGVLKQVRKTLGYLETNLEHQSLKTHEFESFSKLYRIKTFEAYAQHKTSAAYRVFWQYGPDETDIRGKRILILTIVSITPHP